MVIPLFLLTQRSTEFDTIFQGEEECIATRIGAFIEARDEMRCEIVLSLLFQKVVNNYALVQMQS